MESVLCNRNYNSQLIKAIQTRSQLSLVILISWPDLPRPRTGSEIWVRDYGDIGCDVSCLVGIARTQPGYEAESNPNFIVGKRIWTFPTRPTNWSLNLSNHKSSYTPDIFSSFVRRTCAIQALIDIHPHRTSHGPPTNTHVMPFAIIQNAVDLYRTTKYR